MKRISSYLLLMLLVASCQVKEEEMSPEMIDPSAMKVEGVNMTVPEIPYETEGTRAAMAVDDVNGLSFTWSDGDATGVYSTTDGFARFNLVTGGGMSHATFDGGGFSLTGGNTYYAFFPYEMSASDKTAIPLTYSGQGVDSDNDIISPMSKDYMWASAVSDAGNAAFSFAHIGAFLRLQITGLDSGTAIDKVELLPMYGEVPQTMTFDITTHTLTVITQSPVLAVTATGMSVPASGTATVWISMPPQSFATDFFAVKVTSGANVYAARIAGKAFNAGKAYKWSLAPVDVALNPGYGFTTVTETGLSTPSITKGQYSGIAYTGAGNRYAVVDDKLNGGGIVFMTIPINDDGTIGTVTMEVPAGTSSSTVTNMDNEGIAYDGSKLWVSAEADQSIKEYDMDGYLVEPERSLTIPEDMAVGQISSNKGFEALTYNASTELFWTTTESELVKDVTLLPGIIRLQSFGTDKKPASRYLYKMDNPQTSVADATAADQYVFGVPALAALDDGRIIVLEREVYVKTSTLTANSWFKLYVVKPSADGSGILRKTLLKEFSTTGVGLANYEGMCLGPTLGDGSHTLVMIADSQAQALVSEKIKVITFK